MARGITIAGLERTKARIHAALDTAAAEQVVKAYAAKLQQEAMRKAPVDTGNLKRSIMLNIAEDGMEATVTATAEYAAYVEYGTRFMNAQPYMKPAAEMIRPEFQEAMKHAVKKQAGG